MLFPITEHHRVATAEALMLRTVAVLTCLLSLDAGANSPRAQDTPVEARIIEALHKTFGVHPGFRANHAKGIVAEGTFKGSARGAGMSKAAIFSGAPIPVTVRFSDSTGISNLPDGSRLANPHAMFDQVPYAGRQQYRYGD
jgi:catalase